MKVFVDGLPFENEQAGIQRYLSELLRRIAQRHEVTVWLRRRPSAPPPLGCRVVRDTGRAAARYHPVRQAVRAYHRWRGGRAARGHDVIHCAYLEPPALPDIPYVVTVHDLIPERFPYLCTHPWADDDTARKRRAVAAAAVCIAVSQATADDLCAFYPDAAPKVRVIHHGADHLAGNAVPPGVPSRRSVAGRFALFVGERIAYKNFGLVLEAMLEAAWPEGLGLRVVGSAFSEREGLLIRRLGLEGRIRHLGRVPDAELRAAYQESACFIFPSLCEGFGIPVVEAQSFGAPVVCSDIPVFHEVAGASALFFDPRSPADLAARVAAALEPDVRSRLVEAGRDNLRRFSWDRCAAETIAAYQDAISPPARGRVPVGRLSATRVTE